MQCSVLLSLSILYSSSQTLLTRVNIFNVFYLFPYYIVLLKPFITAEYGASALILSILYSSSQTSRLKYHMHNPLYFPYYIVLLKHIRRKRKNNLSIFFPYYIVLLKLELLICIIQKIICYFPYYIVLLKRYNKSQRRA